MNCKNCGRPLEPNVQFCGFCGTQVEEQTIDKKFKEKKKSKLNNATKIALLIMFLAFCILGVSVFIFINKGTSSQLVKEKENKPVKSNNTACQLAPSTDDANELYALLDYSAVAAAVDNYTEEFNSILYQDTNGDGIPELFASTVPESKSYNNAILSFEPLSNCKMTALSQSGAAGNSCISTTKDGKVYMSYTYSTSYSEHKLYEYKNENWVNIATLSTSYNGTGRNVETAVFNDAGNLTEEQWNQKYDSLQLEVGKNNFHSIFSNYFVCDNVDEVINGYNQYLVAFASTEIILKQGDFDKDGETEYAFILPDFWHNWLNNISTIDSNLWSLEEIITEKLTTTGDLLIYADTDKNGVLFRTYYNPKYSGDDILDNEWFVSCVNNELLIKHLETTEYEFDGETKQSTNMRTWGSIFCIDACDVRGYYDANSASELTQATEQYINVLKRETRCTYTAKTEDIADIPGYEIIVVATYNNKPVQSFVGAIINGRLIAIGLENCYTTAYYLTECNGKKALLAYSQTEKTEYISNQTVLTGITYKYKIFRFDEQLNLVEIESRQAECDQTTASAEASEILQIVNKHITSGSVCCDPYEITGYSVMRGSSINNDKYLNISNCSTNKNGYVNITDEWLNFRDGPSINNARILTNPSDPFSFVKQLKGAPLTVIYPENTADTTYPVWVKIQIKYNYQTLDGYSAYKYITIPNIKHIKPNETFKIEANTNDTGLYWSSSDSSVVKINSATGEITGIRSGLVLITVKSSSGLSDSCLIMVD